MRGHEMLKESHALTVDALHMNPWFTYDEVTTAVVQRMGEQCGMDAVEDAIRALTTGDLTCSS